MKTRFYQLPLAPTESSEIPATCFQMDGTETKQFQEIVSAVLPRVLERFEEKNSEYGGPEENEFELGPRAAYVDLARKMRKLKTGIWEGREDLLTSESVEEILGDFIGTSLIILHSRQFD